MISCFSKVFRHEKRDGSPQRSCVMSNFAPVSADLGEFRRGSVSQKRWAERIGGNVLKKDFGDDFVGQCEDGIREFALRSAGNATVTCNGGALARKSGVCKTGWRGATHSYPVN